MDSSRQASDAQQEQFLRIQKENLAAQVKVQKIRIAELETQLQQLQQRESICQQSLLHTEDLWTQLQRSLHTVAEETGVMPSAHRLDNNKLPVHAFLEGLVSRDASTHAAVQARLEALQSKLSENERMLSSRASGSQQILAAILSRVRASTHMQPRSQDGSAGGSSESVDTRSLDTPSLHDKLQAQQGIHLATQALLDQASSQNALLKNRIADLQNLLLDSEDSLDTARKKIAKQGTNAAPGIAERGDNAARQTTDVELAAELEQLQQMLQQRTCDLEHQKSVGSRLEKYVFSALQLTIAWTIHVREADACMGCGMRCLLAPESQFEHFICHVNQCDGTLRHTQFDYQVCTCTHMRMSEHVRI